jgi:hypothetical protein
MQTHSHGELQPEQIRATIDVLARRIAERFPESGLSRVAAELSRLAQENQRVVEQISRPIWWVRGVIALAIGAVVALVGWVGFHVWDLSRAGVGGAAELVQGIDAATSEILFLSLVLLFLASVETRLKRRLALRMLHRLRSIAHVVDMHQLTKDPARAIHPVESTPSSPQRTIPRSRLGRYLDYCSELLSLTSKLAALHSQHLQDHVVLDAVNDIESLTLNLSRKIWQKIMILDTAIPRTFAPEPE